jgi:molecular chaperone GrpE
MTDPLKQQLLEEFTEFLDETEFEDQDLTSAPDLHTLLSEMVVLKTEVKKESRHIKTMLDQYGQTLQLLEADNQILKEQLAKQKQQKDQQKSEIERAMLLQWLEVYDRISAGAALLKRYKPVDALFSHSKKQDRRFIHSLKDGQDMSIQRMEQLLLSFQVKAIETESKILDPHLMIAVATVNNKKLSQGQVVEEIRKGFFYKNKVLRLAEVKVNKIEP